MDMCLPKFDIYLLKKKKKETNSWQSDFVQKNCMMSCLKFTLPDVTLFLPDNLTGLKKKLYSGLIILAIKSKN